MTDKTSTVGDARASQLRRLVPTLLLGAFLASTSHAMTIRELRTLEAKEKDGKAYASYYLVGVVEGLRESSDEAKRHGDKPTICIDGRRLEPSMARSIYQTELARNKDQYEADMPVQLVVAEALRNSYRCSP